MSTYEGYSDWAEIMAKQEADKEYRAACRAMLNAKNYDLFRKNRKEREDDNTVARKK